MTIWRCQTCEARMPVGDDSVTFVGRAPYHTPCRSGKRAGLMVYVGEVSKAATPAAVQPPRPLTAIEMAFVTGRTKPDPSMRGRPEGFNRPFARLLPEKGLVTE
jgi:hypothetical protein